MMSMEVKKHTRVTLAFVHAREGSAFKRRAAFDIEILSAGILGQHASATPQAFSYDTPLDSRGFLTGRSFFWYTAIITAISFSKWEKGGKPLTT